MRILITGGSSGLGLELAKLFVEEGAEVYATGRKVPESLINNARFHFLQVDFSDLKQVSKVISNLVASQVEFDLVVNNAGILSPSFYVATKDGFEITLQVNFLSHLLINDLIIRSIGNGKSIKIAFVTSPVYKYVNPGYRLPVEKGYKPFRTYSETKYYLLLTGSFLKSIYPEKEIRVFGLDPGIFSSGIYRMQKKWFHIMYMVGALFMRGSGKVAHNLYTILNDPGISENKIYHRSGKRSHPIPELNDTSEKFLFACHKALNILG